MSSSNPLVGFKEFSRRGIVKTIKARDDDNQETYVFQTQEGQCTFELREREAACTRPAQTPTRGQPRAEIGKQTQAPPNQEAISNEQPMAKEE